MVKHGFVLLDTNFENNLKNRLSLYKDNIFQNFSKKTYSAYNTIFINDLKESLLYNLEYDNFSIGIFYLLLSDFNTQKIDKSIQLDIAVRLEIIFILADFLDDIFDYECSSSLPIEESIINIMVVLFSIIDDLSTLTYHIETNQIINCLSKSIQGELADYYSSIGNNSIPSTYFKKMTLKSISLLELVIYIANSNQPIWKKFAAEIATALQLRNDAEDILNPNKSDLRLFKETFPLIKAKEYAIKNGDIRFTSILDTRKNDRRSLDYVLNYIKSSGAIEVSIYLSSYYSKSAIKNLKIAFPNNKKEIAVLKKYLKI